MPAGRPRKHNREKIMQAVCERISTGELVLDVADDLGVAPSCVFAWALEPQFAEPYARARVSQAHALAEETMRLADKAIDGKDGDVNARRLQVDTRKWFTSKLAPKLYGEKVDVTSDGKRIQSLLVLPPES